MQPGEAVLQRRHRTYRLIQRPQGKHALLELLGSAHKQHARCCQRGALPASGSAADDVPRDGRSHGGGGAPVAISPRLSLRSRRKVQQHESSTAARAHNATESHRAISAVARASITRPAVRVRATTACTAACRGGRQPGSPVASWRVPGCFDWPWEHARFDVDTTRGRPHKGGERQVGCSRDTHAELHLATPSHGMAETQRAAREMRHTPRGTTPGAPCHHTSKATRCFSAAHMSLASTVRRTADRSRSWSTPFAASLQPAQQTTPSRAARQRRRPPERTMRPTRSPTRTLCCPRHRPPHPSPVHAAPCPPRAALPTGCWLVP